MITRSLVILWLGMTACTRDRSPSPAFEGVARHANPSLLLMKRPAAWLRMGGAIPDVDLIRACTSADAQLEVLASLSVDGNVFPDDEPARAIKHIAAAASSLLPDGRNKHCSPASMEHCASYCLFHWDDIMHMVEKVRWYAREHGVEIVSLKR
jgi:hypothetical protein